MSSSSDIAKSLERLDPLCNAGFAMALHINFTTPRFLFQTYDDAWMDAYSQKGYVMQDPTVLWGMENNGVADWESLRPLDEAGVMAEAEEYGIRYGITYAVNSNNSKSIMSFARSDRPFTEQEVAEICQAAEALHDGTAGRPEISQQDREVLKQMSVRFTHR